MFRSSVFQGENVHLGKQDKVYQLRQKDNRRSNLRIEKIYNFLQMMMVMDTKTRTAVQVMMEEFNQVCDFC